MKGRWCFGIDDFRIPAKKNSYVLKFNPVFFTMIRDIVKRFRATKSAGRAGNPYWIGPSDEVKQAEETIAWYAAEFVRKDITGDVELRIEAYGMADTDNLLGALLDGLQKSGRIKNDRQVRKITIERILSSKRKGFTMELIEL